METLYIILGWLLGILSPAVTDKIANARKQKELKRILIHDLKDLRGRLVMIPLIVHPSYGTLDETIFNWVKKQTNNFKELGSDEDSRKGLEGLYTKDDVDLKTLLNHWNTSSNRRDPAWSFKKMNTSIIDSNLLQFELLEDNFLIKLLEIRFQINAFNEEVKNVNEYLKMTFDSSITEVNMQIIKNEIDKKNYLISKKAMFIVEKINQAI